MVPRPQLHVRVKKSLSLFDGPNTVASVKAFGNLDTSGQVWVPAGLPACHVETTATHNGDSQLA